jgi:carbon monoxide dehydrogenase subunit G
MLIGNISILAGDFQQSNQQRTMNLTGKYILQAPISKVWHVVLDPVVLARITPMISKLEQIEPDQYKAIAQVKIGPVQGEFTGGLQVKDKVAYERFSLAVQQNSKMGNAAADIHLKFLPLDELQTEVSFNGLVRLSGTLSIMGQRVLSPIANMLSKQFFEALEKEVLAHHG